MNKLPQSVSDKGINLIKEYEGLRLNRYKDAVGKWTIGYGHLITPEESSLLRVSESEAEELLRHDLKVAERAIQQLVTIQLTQNQFDALASFTFNLGAGNLKNSTLLSQLNKGLYEQAANEFLRWNRAGGKVLAGLVRRRQAEQDLFCGVAK